MKKAVLRNITVSIMAILLMLVNLTRIPNSDCIRAIHVLTLMIMGAATYVLIFNVVAIFKSTPKEQ